MAWPGWKLQLTYLGLVRFCATMILSLVVGIGLASACGFRILVPPLVIGILSHLGLFDLPEALAWADQSLVLIALGVAAAVETAAFAIPAVNNALDVIAAPVAAIAGMAMAAGIMSSHLDGFVLWSMAAIAGGGASGLVHGATAILRATSVGNPLQSTGETAASLGATLLAVLIPLAAFAVIAGAVALIYVRRRRKKKGQP
ncbi:MAG: DUF4126 domain-containing protein [Bacteroidota bacterium]|nr:DUF4126 domain-containing protein [Bacteroidota bacterium]